ncbi:MAG: hypothetical protein IPL67_18870 [Ignavibacteria bacterium]|nr:hypothetical protein [Ignavibacteria bacterium]
MKIQFLKKYSKTILLIILLMISLFTAAKTFRSHLITINYPYQLEYREGAVLAVTDLYVKNENPYDLKFQPEHTYNYGFLYPLTTSFFAEFFGNSLAVHRWVTYASILITCLLVFFSLIHLKVNTVLSFTGAVILHQTLVYNGLTSIARPEGFGILLYVTGILLVWRFKFSMISLIACVMTGIFGYLTKPYYLFAIPAIFLYLLFFISKKKAAMFAVISILMFIVMIFIVNESYDTFFNNTFFVHVNYSDSNLSHMMSQVILYVKINAVLLVILFLSVVFLISGYSNFRNGNMFVIKDFWLKLKDAKILKWNEPIFKTETDVLFGFLMILSLTIFVFYLGGNTGSDNAAYLFHLSSPFLILTAFQLANKVRSYAFTITIVLLLIFTLGFQFKPKSYTYTKQIEKSRIIEDLISGKENILNSAETVSIIIGQEKKLYNSGHTEYFQSGKSELSGFLGMSENTEIRNTEFKNEISNKIALKEFDLILISETISSFAEFIDKSILIKHYEISDTLSGPLSKIEVWLPVK